MHTPMTKEEVACFLELPPSQVEQLWRLGDLQRSLHHPNRPIPELSQSSVYDVLEYALVSGDLPVKLTRELAALWVASLAEADEWEDFSGASWDLQTVMLVRAAQDDGLDCMTVDPELTSIVILSSREVLRGLIAARDCSGFAL